LNHHRARRIAIAHPNLAPEERRPVLVPVSMAPQRSAGGRFAEGQPAAEGPEQAVVEGPEQPVVEGPEQPVVEGQPVQLPRGDFPGQRLTLRSSIKRGERVSCFRHVFGAQYTLVVDLQQKNKFLASLDVDMAEIGGD
jgi:hypothetical protein